jgi:hypothetical protein
MHLVYESSSAFRRLSSTLSSSLTMCNWVIEKGSDQSPLVLVWTDDYDILGLDFFFFSLTCRLELVRLRQEMAQNVHLWPIVRGQAVLVAISIFDRT